MLDPGYIVAVLVLTFAITFAVRAVPFTVLGALRESTIVRELSVWMPVGILGILAVTAFRGTVLALPGHGIVRGCRRGYHNRDAPAHLAQRRNRHRRLRHARQSALRSQR